MEKRKAVICPVCKRRIAIDILGKSINGEEVMIWHLQTPTSECQGSFKSEVEAKKLA